MAKRVFKFSVEVYGDVNSGFVMPVYDEYGTLVGGATCLFGNVIQFFIGGDGFPAALKVSSEETIWITPRLDAKCQVSHCILSEAPLGPESSRVPMALEENVINDTALENPDGPATA